MDIPKTQKAAVLHEHGGQVAVMDIPVASPDELKPGEALVNVLYSGACHTDLHAAAGDWPIPSKLPLIGGHEGAGVVVAIGKHSDTDLKVGDKVGIKWIAHSCNKCVFCRQGYESLCKSAKMSGFTVDGSFQQYAVSYTSQLSKIPDALPLPDAAPILCAGVTVWKAIKVSEAKPGEWIAIPGAGGGLGHLALQYAAYMGLRTIAIDTGAEKKALCEKLGAAAWIDFDESKDLVKDIQAAVPDGYGPHASIVAAANASAYEQAMEYVRPHGTVVCVGLPRDSVVKANVFTTTLLEQQLKGSYVGSRHDTAEALDIAASGKVRAIYKIQPLSTLGQVFDSMRIGTMTGRVVLDLNS